MAIKKLSARSAKVFTEDEVRFIASRAAKAAAREAGKRATDAAEDAAKRIVETAAKTAEVMAASNSEHIRAVVSETLTLLGIQNNDPTEMQKDFQHLRKWRLAVALANTKAMLAAVAVIVTGGLGLIWLGFTTLVGAK